MLVAGRLWTEPVMAALALIAVVALPGPAWGGKPSPREEKTDSQVCRPGTAGRIWISPRSPSSSRPLRIMGVADTSGLELSVSGPKGKVAVQPVLRGGPPWSASAIVAAPPAGTYTVELLVGGKPAACRRVRVAARAERVAAALPAGGPVWEARQLWDRSSEAFYSAWIEQLFDAPPADALGFRPLQQALRDPVRNFLFDHLGLHEDDPRNKAALPAAPDCADLPYYLRLYFAWKMGLPFGFRDCDRGQSDRPPRCTALLTNEQPAEAPDALGAMRKFIRQVMNKVHSGSARTALDDDESDYYPVKLDREVLRPGTVYADPYGHVMMIVKWVDGTGDGAGLLLAVDGQPDASVGRKRFWEGTFLFASDVKSAGPGFKAFRPLVRGPAVEDGRAPLVALRNKELDGRHVPYSREQASMSGDAFYARMSRLINPRGLDAAQAYQTTLDALVEQLQTRVGSVDNGEKYMRQVHDAVVAMPEGAKIFETVGPWEDYATPSRDMRLIIAMNVLLDVPDRIVRHPELFNLGGRKPEEVRTEIRKLHERSITERGIEYRRSDGTSWRLTVAELLARKAAFEMAYNPNDCVEVRWGAPDGSREQGPCTRHAPADQKARMAEVRSWFRDAKRPAR